ncbi:MAG: D-alanine--D-alanine ligase [Ginsengibacter sp.]
MKKIIQKVKDWEQWPFKVLYAPIAPVWGWYILKSGSVWFFTPSNPKLTFGGMEGEPKREMYDLLPPSSFPTTINIKTSEPFENVLAGIQGNDITFPLIAKPEVGGQGILVRKINTEEELKNYHENSPVEYIVQELVTYPLEVSVFYYRFPDQQKGVVTGFLKKVPLQVVGNGKSTLLELILNDNKASKRFEEIRPMHESNFNTIPAKDEVYKIRYAANHNRGAKFIDLKDEIDEKLVSVFDKISTGIDDFFYGRYDIMCTSVEDLKAGKNFSILEYNGCGAEPNHFYDTGYTLVQAYKEILHHWKVLYKISSFNRKKGIKSWPLMKGLKFLKETKDHYKVIKAADLHI